jgi:glycosyltransferase involved in cell wall biosynthesis
MHVAILSQQLSARGHQPVCLCRPGTRLEKAFLHNGLPVLRHNPFCYFDPVAIARCSRYFSRYAFDILHVHYSRDLWSVVPAVRLTRPVPIVFIKHIGTQKPKRDIVHKWIYNSVDHVIAISDVIARNLLSTHPLRPDQVSVVHHGIDVDHYRFSRELRSSIRAEFNIPENAMVLGTVGRLQTGKGQLEFLAMAQRIADEFPSAYFLIVGGPTHGEEFRAQPIYDKVKEMNLAERLIMTGFRTDVAALLSAMDIFIFPSHAEAFGLVVIEAMACGLPVISSRCDGILDIITNQQNGLLVDPKNVEELTAAVHSLMLDRKTRKRLAENGRALVMKKFNVRYSVDKVEEIYHGLMAGKIKVSGAFYG